MKKIWWVLLSIGISLFFILLILSIPVIWLNQSWWWLGGILIFELIVWGIIGIIFLLKSIRKKAPETEKVNLTELKEKAREFVMMDDDNPDNFVINEPTLFGNEGEAGKETTPVIAFRGEGTEMKNKINVIIDLTDSKGKMIRMDNVSKEELIERMKKIAKNPEKEITEEKTLYSEFGKPLSTTRTTRASQIEKQQQQEKEKAEKANVL